MALRPHLGLLGLADGIGQLGLAVHAGLATVGLGTVTLAHVERDAAAAAYLRLRMEAQELGFAPVSDDLADFDGRRFRGFVSGICAGLPCPAFSTAGKRVGNLDPRAWGEGFDADDMATWGPIPHSLRIIAESEPGFVFFENVPGWIRSGAFEPVGRELRGLGYTRQAAIFVAAEDVGAPHGRERGFVLAVSEQWRRWIIEQIGRADRRAVVGRAGEELADESCNGWQQGRAESNRLEGRSDAAECGEQLANAKGNNGWQGGGANDDPIGRHASHGSVAVRSTRLGDTKHKSARRGDAGQVGPTSEGDKSGRPGAGTGGDCVPLYPPPRGTDLAAVAETLLNAVAVETGPGRTYQHQFAEAHSATRRHAAAACRLARGIWRDWTAVACLDPTLMPATESNVSVVVDGHPYSTADLLRLGGNSVVADAAAVAFVELWHELIGGG